MSELTRTYNRYPGLYTDWVWNGEDWTTVQKPMTQNMMLPDTILDVLKSATTSAAKAIFEQHLNSANALPPLNRHRLLIPEPKISWAESCALVTEAFKHFDNELGGKVATVLSDPTRYKMKKVEPGEANGYCVPPGWQGHERAKINYAYDETINDAVYLAHELGHLLANDFAQEAGYQKEDTWIPRHVSEVPAMFTQCILYDYLMNGQKNTALQNAARQHFTGEMTRSLYEQQVAFALDAMHPPLQDDYEARMRESLGDNWRSFSRAQDRQSSVSNLHGHISAATIGVSIYFSSLGRNLSVFDAMFKRGKDSDILDVFEKAGVKSERQLADLLAQAVEVSKKVLGGIASINKPQSAAKTGAKLRL